MNIDGRSSTRKNMTSASLCAVHKRYKTTKTRIYPVDMAKWHNRLLFERTDVGITLVMLSDDIPLHANAQHRVLVSKRTLAEKGT